MAWIVWPGLWGGHTCFTRESKLQEEFEMGTEKQGREKWDLSWEAGIFAWVHEYAEHRELGWRWFWYLTGEERGC